MKKIFSTLLILTLSIGATYAQKDRSKLENNNTLNGSNTPSKALEAVKTTTSTTTAGEATDKGSTTQPAAGHDGTIAQPLDNGKPDFETEIVAPNTDGMSPARAAKTKYMHKNNQVKAKTADAEMRLAKYKAAAAKSRSSLESKKKKGKISAADYEAGMAKVKAVEEQIKYLETMVGEAKTKVF
jgi:hypothetical protein